MTKKNSTKKALITSALCLLLCVSMLVGATFAWFTDSVSTTNNIITAGNLDVNLYWSTNGTDWTAVDASTNVFKTGTLWEPGHTEVVYLKVANEGTLALKYSLDVNVASEVAGTNVAGESFKLSDYILYNVTNGVATFANSAAARGDESGNKLNAPYNNAASLEAGEAVELTMVVFMPTTVGNEANYKKDTTAPSINLGINLYATQYTYEADSYGPNYDANAKLPIGDAEALAAAMTEGGIYVLAADIAVDSNTAMIVPAGVEVILDMNGHEINASANTNDANKNVFVVKGDMTVTGNGTLTTVFTGENMEWSRSSSIFSVEGGELTLGEGVSVINYGGTNMAYGVDVNSTGGKSVLNVNGATILSTYTAVREFNNSKTAQAIVNFNSGLVAGDSRDIWVHNPSANAVDANGIVNNNTGMVPTVTVQAATSFYGRIYDFDYGYVLVNSASALQKALDAATDGTVIKLGVDLKGDVTATKKAGVNVTIDGNGMKFNGMLTVLGEYDTGSLTIKNVNFVAAAGADAAIYAPAKYDDGVAHNNYVKNVTVENCTFTDPDGDRNCAAIRHGSGGKKFWTIKNCVVDNTMHSLLQVSNIEESLVIEGCEVYSKNGINLNYGAVLEMTNCIFDVEGYAVRVGVNGAVNNGTFNITDCTLSSDCAASDDAVIVLRGDMAGATLNLDGTTLTGTRDIIR